MSSSYREPIGVAMKPHGGKNVGVDPTTAAPRAVVGDAFVADPDKMGQAKYSGWSSTTSFRSTDATGRNGR